MGGMVMICAPHAPLVGHQCTEVIPSKISNIRGWRGLWFNQVVLKKRDAESINQSCTHALSHLRLFRVWKSAFNRMVWAHSDGGVAELRAVRVNLNSSLSACRTFAIAPPATVGGCSLSVENRVCTDP